MSFVAFQDLIHEGTDHLLLDKAKLDIHPEDISLMNQWAPATSVRIMLENVLADYPFRFVNMDTGESIRVRLEE
jgi:hypothetical protein